MILNEYIIVPARHGDTMRNKESQHALKLSKTSSGMCVCVLEDVLQWLTLQWGGFTVKGIWVIPRACFLRT